MRLPRLLASLACLAPTCQASRLSDGSGGGSDGGQPSQAEGPWSVLADRASVGGGDRSGSQASHQADDGCGGDGGQPSPAEGPGSLLAEHASSDGRGGEVLEYHPLLIYAPGQQQGNKPMKLDLKTERHGVEKCEKEMEEHFLSMAGEKTRAEACSREKQSATMIWDVPAMLITYFDISETSAGDSGTGSSFDAAVDRHRFAYVSSEIWGCCPTCAWLATVPILSRQEAVTHIEQVQQAVCSPEAIEEADKTWDDLVLEAQKAKWDHETEGGGRCIDPGTCEANRLHQGKKWCYVEGNRSFAQYTNTLGWPWDYCMPSIRYACATRGLRCAGQLSDYDCDAASDEDTCGAIYGCAFKGLACVPKTLELEGLAPPALSWGVSGLTPKFGGLQFWLVRKKWESYYRSKLDRVLFRVAAGNSSYTDLIEACSRLPSAYCEAPCTHDGLRSSLAAGQLTPFETSFGYCSFHGHYAAKAVRPWTSTVNQMAEVMRIGSMELGLKFINLQPLLVCVSFTAAAFGTSILPAAFASWFFGFFGGALTAGYVLAESFFTTFVPRTLVSAESFRTIVTAPLVEEVIFRGLLSKGVRFVADTSVRGVIALVEKLGIFGGRLKEKEIYERYAFVVTQLTVAFAFGYIHTFGKHEGAAIQAVFTFWNGLTMQVIEQKYGIAYTTLAHFINNAFTWMMMKGLGR